MRPSYYRLLADHSVEPIYDVLEWAREFETAERRVALDTVGSEELSTVFLGLDHSWSDDRPPVLFESCVFDADGDSQVQARYASWDEAVAGHAELKAEMERAAAEFAALMTAD